MLQFLHLSDLHFRSKPKDNQEILAMLHYIKVTYPQRYLIITDGYACLTQKELPVSCRKRSIKVKQIRVKLLSN